MIPATFEARNISKVPAKYMSAGVAWAIVRWGVARGWGGSKPSARASLHSCAGALTQMKKFETFQRFKTTGQLSERNGEAGPSIHHVQYLVLTTSAIGFETLASMSFGRHRKRVKPKCTKDRLLIRKNLVARRCSRFEARIRRTANVRSLPPAAAA
jgi:hypothetical protein